MSRTDRNDSNPVADDTAHEPIDGTARYLYCLVDVTDEAGDPGELEIDGIEDNPVRLVRYEDIGVIVHPCESVYDSEDFDQVRRWLLAHQRVVDAAGERFGTPLPFRFDTILRGDEEAVREWVSGHVAEIRDSLEAFAATWEYRIHLTWDPEALTELLVEADEGLTRPRPDSGEDGAGTSFLKEKQFEQRLQTARQQRKEAVEDELAEALSDLARAVEPADRPRIPDEGSQGPSPFAGFSILAHDDQVEAIGDRLDDVATLPGLEVTFTGPWPPYTFAPSIGEEP